MMEEQLSEKQRAFVVAYLKSFHGTRAAEAAGYAYPAVEASRLLTSPKIKERINQHLDSIREEGIGNRANRLAQLSSLNDDLMVIQNARAQEAIARIDAGEELPAGVETGLLEETTKQFGTGANATVEKVWSIDKTLVGERQKLLEQAAREVGDRDKRIVELSGPEGGPVEIASAKHRLLDLTKDG